MGAVLVNNNAATNSMYTLKVLKAIELYTNEIPSIMKKCLIQEGFNKSDIKECGSLYTHFLGMALEYDFERLENLKNSSNIIEMNSLIFTKSINNINTANNCKLQKIRKALTRYKFESCLILVKCMMKVGFQSSEIEMSDSNYHLCFETAIQCETMRWRYLRSNFRQARKKMINKNKAAEDQPNSKK